MSEKHEARKRLPTATVDLTCDECGDLIVTMALQKSHFLSIIHAARREHAKAAHEWTEAPSDAHD